jgi:arginine-tRNA-protein transferase
VSAAPDEHPDACAYPSLPPPVRVPLRVFGDEPCPYLPGRVATHRGLLAGSVDPGVYHRFMDRAYRRSGHVLYQPVCRGCRQCTPLRVPVATFRPSKSQRRCARRNADLAVSTGRPTATDEKYDLYRRYQLGWHGPRAADADAPGGAPSRDGFESFLYDSPVDSLEFEYRDPSGRLLAVGICDACAASLSSVYFYFDPADAGRGLGTFGAVREIAWAAERGVPHYYLGYYVRDCPSMAYKATFRPYELLGPDGAWRAPAAAGGAG